MHPASAFHEADRSILSDFVRTRSFASIVGIQGSRAVTTAAPILLSGDSVRFHLSSRNALTPVLVSSSAALIIVMAGDAYVSPDWYVGADQVPTWNYRSVEIEGPLRVMERDETEQLLDDLSAEFERRLAPKPPWTRDKMRPGVFDAMLGAVTGFEMKVDRLEGTMKMSQNKPPSEVARVAAALAARPDAGSQAMSALMTARSDTPPSATLA